LQVWATSQNWINFFLKTQNIVLKKHSPFDKEEAAGEPKKLKIKINKGFFVKKKGLNSPDFYNRFPASSQNIHGFFKKFTFVSGL